MNDDRQNEVQAHYRVYVRIRDVLFCAHFFNARSDERFQYYVSK